VWGNAQPGNRSYRDLRDSHSISVEDMLRPMLASWLDVYLPPLVEKLVREERMHGRGSQVLGELRICSQVDGSLLA
jgi:hypothetical protein